LVRFGELRRATGVVGVVGIWDGDPVQGGDLRELLGGSGVAEQAVVDGELG